MSAKWEKKGTNTGTLTFEIDIDTINEGLTKTFNRVKKNLSVPGFRKGKVSRQVFNKMYGEESLYEDTLNALLPEAYEAAVVEANIDPVAPPKIDIVSMEKGQPWVLEAEITVTPEVKLGEYKNIKVPKQDRTVTDEEVEAKLVEEQNKLAELVLVEEGVSELGDTVVIDFEGFVDGEAFEGGKAENYALELGSNTFIPGFEDQLVGKKPGEETEVTVTFPEDYQAEALAGKDAVFKVTVHEVKRKEVPELDDEFAKDVDDSVETLAELKQKIRETLEEQKINHAEEEVERLALEKVVENAEIIDLPEVMITEEVNRSFQSFMNNLRQQGITPELYYQITGTDEEAMKEQLKEDAEKRVRTNLVVSAIVEQEDTEVSQEEIDAKIAELAEEYKLDVQKVRQSLTDDMLVHDIRMEKALDAIFSTVTEEA